MTKPSHLTHRNSCLDGVAKVKTSQIITFLNKLKRKDTLRPDFTSKLVHILAFGTPKFYIALYDKIKHELVRVLTAT